ncbi:MAG: polysaccharide export outer membrane protein [Candidatus Latescibacterota bacterium]|jgi:polysaccharide export outer membrane protein
MRLRMLTGAFALVFAWLALAPVAWAQEDELQSLVEDSAQDEADLRNTPGGSIPGLDNDIVSGKFRMPSGEEVEKLRISQDLEVDPDVYLVGPGDVLQLYIWGEFDLSYLLQVDPEGNVLIPTVGAFHVSDKTLSVAKQHIYDAAQEKYTGVDITISLASMRFFTAYVTGAVLREGSFTIHPTTRVSDLIERSGGFLDELQGTTIQEEVAGRKITRVRRIQNRPTGRRTIKLIHRDNVVDNVDLDMFHSTGSVEHNPYVRMGDVVNVGFRNESAFIFGAVNQEGEQEYRAGDTIADLVALAKGLRTDAPLVMAELWRFEPGTENTIKIPLGNNGIAGQEFTFADIKDMPVQSNDMVFIRARSLWQQMPTVIVYGEVKYRGRFRIVPGETRLRDIVDGASGGLTDNASLIGSKVIRTKMRNQVDPEFERLQKLAQVSGLTDMSSDDKAYLKTKGREEKGRAAVDFERLYKQDDEQQNILLESGDVIYIPTTRGTISASGQLKKPGLIDFEDGRTVRYYLSRAGGYSYGADKGGARLIRARTGVREKLDNGLIVEAGDELWVPEKERVNIWAFTQSTMRTIAETLTLIILIRSL